MSGERDEDRTHIDCLSCSGKPAKMKNAKPHQPNDIRAGDAKGPCRDLQAFFCLETRLLPPNLREISLYLSLIDLRAMLLFADAVQEILFESDLPACICSFFAHLTDK